MVWREVAPVPPPLGAAAQAQSAENRAANRARAAARAKSMVRRLVLNAGHDHLVTLTFPGEGVQDYDEACEHLSGFVRWSARWLAREGGMGRDYVAVAELHPGGHGWHWHITFSGWVDVVLLRLRWTHFLAGRGLVTTRAKVVMVNARHFPDRRKLGGYLAKYMAKTFDSGAVPEGRHRYRVGSETPRPDREAFFAATENPADLTAVEQHARQLAGGLPLTWAEFQTEIGRGIVVTWLLPSVSPPLRRPGHGPGAVPEPGGTRPGLAAV